MNSSNKGTKAFLWAAAVAIIIIAIVLYVASLGTAELTDKGDLPKELNDTKEQAIKRHDALKKQLQQKIALKEKLEKRFKMAYAAVRFGLVAFWIGPLGALYHFKVINDLDDALNYSEATLFVGLIFNFVTFGSLRNLNDFIYFVKLRVENWVWGKHLTLNDDIAAHNIELEEISASLQTPDQAGFPKKPETYDAGLESSRLS